MQTSQRVKKARVGISYARVSTTKQSEDEDTGFRKDDGSPEVQKDRCANHLNYLESKHGTRFSLLEHISDEGFSGKNTNRPGYKRMWEIIASGRIDFIVSTELSRLSRSVLDFLELVSHCEKHKVDVYILNLDLDTSTAFGRMLVVILVALAQFEREMTSQRVYDNQLARLLKDGKINGASEILGLDRDPNKRGHFLVNHEELRKVEKLLNLFLRFSSKKKVLEEAKRLGITGKRGREITAHMLDILLENVRWRYRGKWYVNKENMHQEQLTLPDSQRFQTIALPHGQLIESKLLDKVESKVRDTYDKKKRSGKDDYVYLLSHVLEYEDGSKFQGQPGKDRQYRYYFNKNHKLRIRCDELDPAISKRVKNYFLDKKMFGELVKKAIEQRQMELPKIDAQISRIKTDIAEIEKMEMDLQGQLIDPSKRSKPEFMQWLEAQVSSVLKRKQGFLTELASLERYRADLLTRAGLTESVEGYLKEFVDGYDRFTGTEKRNLIGRIVKRVVVKAGNKLDIEIYGQSPVGPLSQRKKSTGKELIGATDGA